MPNRLVEIAEDSAREGLFLFTGNALSTLILAVGSILVAKLFSISLVAPSILLLSTDFGRFIAKH